MKILYTAIAFFSRIPTPRNLEYSDDAQSRAFRYFPLVGIIIGVIGAAVFMLSGYVLPQIVAVIVALAAMMLATGCLHEDGVADFFDGFGGGTTPEKVLAIMKDSHIGAYGVVSLIVLLALKIALLSELPYEQIPLVIIASQAFARTTPILLINSSQYVRVGESKASFTRNRISTGNLLIALAFGLAPLALFLDWRFFAILVVCTTLLFFGFRAYLHKRIGGFTGDTLGALEQFTELVFLLTISAI